MNNTLNQVDLAVKSGYAQVNGLEMYYEMHGSGQPLVLLHGALSATGTSFGKLIPALAKDRQVISIEQQAHGHTADIDRPLSVSQMADDTAAALQQIGITQADFFGYSLGAGIALDIAIRYPQLVRKLVIASVTYTRAGFMPGTLQGIDSITPEMMTGSPWQVEYAQIAPNPDHWAQLVGKVKNMNRNLIEWTPEAVRSVQAPTLLIIGDADIVQPEHAIEMFRLLGGATGDPMNPPKSQLAVLPGTSHTDVIDRDQLLLSIVPAFLNA